MISLLGIREGLRPRLDVHPVLAVRGDEPLDLTAEALECLLRGRGKGVGDIDERALVA